MDLLKEILREHSKRQANRIVRYVGSDPKRYSELIDVYVKGPYRVTQRAAWPLGLCAEKHPILVLPHLKRLLHVLQLPNIPDAVKRNTMRLLQFVPIPKRYYGEVIDYCFTYLQDKSETIAVRVFSMIVLSNLIKNEPELSNELKIILEDELPYASPGFSSRAKKILKLLVQKPKS